VIYVSHAYVIHDLLVVICRHSRDTALACCHAGLLLQVSQHICHLCEACFLAPLHEYALPCSPAFVNGHLMRNLGPFAHPQIYPHHHHHHSQDMLPH
jgi:hypothetical protein